MHEELGLIRPERRLESLLLLNVVYPSLGLRHLVVSFVHARSLANVSLTSLVMSSVLSQGGQGLHHEYK